jgi:transcriptional regulator with XRE-family HTH domain
MLTLEQVRERLQDRRLGKVAEATGLCAATVSRIRDGKGEPSLKTMMALSAYLERAER